MQPSYGTFSRSSSELPPLLSLLHQLRLNRTLLLLPMLALVLMTRRAMLGAAPLQLSLRQSYKRAPLQPPLQRQRARMPSLLRVER